MSESLASTRLDSAAIRGYSLLRESCGLIPVTEFALLEMTGEDRKAWLQGQCTNDLRQLGAGGSLSFCVCSPTGQMLASCTAWSLPGRFLIVSPKASVNAMLERAESMVIIEDVQLKDISESFDWVSIQGPTASRELASHADVPTLDAGAAPLMGEETLFLRSNRTGYGGWDLLMPRGSDLRPFLMRAFETVEPVAVDLCRLEAGIPRFGLDMGERTLPPEMGLDFEARHISYSKGCYTGQEVLMRIHSRGHTNRTWVTLLLDGPVARGDTVSHGNRGECGAITSAAESPHFGFIAGAMLKNEAVFEGEQIGVRTSHGDVAGEVALRPLLGAI